MSDSQQMTEASGSEVQNGHNEKRSQSVLDDSSSTDSVPSALIGGSYKRTLSNNRIQSSPNRAKNHRSKETYDRISTHGRHSPSSETTLVNGHSLDATGNKVSQPEPEPIASALKIEMQLRENLVEKEEVVSLENNQTTIVQVDAERQSSSSPGKDPHNIIQQAKQSTLITTSNTVVSASVITTEPTSCKESTSSSTSHCDKVPTMSSRSSLSASTPSEAQKQNIPAKINSPHQANAMSRICSAPVIPAPKSTARIAPTVHAVPSLSRSVSATGRLGTDPSPTAPSYAPQSYRNAIIGKTISSSGPGFTDDTASLGSVVYSQSPSVYLSSSSMLPPQFPARKDQTSVRPGLTFGCLKPEAMNGQHLQRDDSYHESTSTRSSQRFGSSLIDNMEKLDIYGKLRKELCTAGLASRVSPYQVQGTIAEEFPHLDIINDLLDDEQNIGRTSRSPYHAFNRQYSLPGNLSTAEFRSLTGTSQYDQSEQYYEEGFLGGYGTSNHALQGPNDALFQQVDFSSYANSHGQFDGLMRNHWPYSNTDLSMLRLSDGDANGYPYQIRDYLTRGRNGSLYRPANGP
ncbi:MATH domain-containing protein [Canna indica]|uniref:MATH domain-containing protein n=1 Tax=Canna indica TaxID=4628 RepID=A0AAQ3QQA2_9LILI|nr:MATH domain-containing protein [Canna indica]